MDSLSRVIKFAQCNKHVQESLDIIEKALTKYKLENTCISFNGGKDCTAVLHLVHSAAKKLCPNNNEPKLVAFYAPLPNHFKEESDFVQETARRYDLKLMQYSSNSLKESLFQFRADAPSIEAIFIGTRKDDFKSGFQMTAMEPTDGNWPKYMRVNPILNWSYLQVWEFIRELDIPYCDLYNQGYSSLGTQDNTTKNSSLLRYDEAGKPYYLPAWSLTDLRKERFSRLSSLDMANSKKDVGNQG